MESGRLRGSSGGPPPHRIRTASWGGCWWLGQCGASADGGPGHKAGQPKGSGSQQRPDPGTDTGLGANLRTALFPVWYWLLGTKSIWSGIEGAVAALSLLCVLWCAQSRDNLHPQVQREPETRAGCVADWNLTCDHHWPAEHAWGKFLNLPYPQVHRPW